MVRQVSAAMYRLSLKQQADCRLSQKKVFQGLLYITACVTNAVANLPEKYAWV